MMMFSPNTSPTSSSISHRSDRTSRSAWVPDGPSITDVLIDDVLRLVLDQIEELLNVGFLSRLDVLSLAKCSKWFYAAALPLIYRSITFDCRMNKTAYEKTWACCATLAKRPHLAALVRSCTIEDSFNFWDKKDHFPKQWNAVGIPALINMKNLQELRWYRAVIMPAVWSAICSLDNLRSLHLVRCSMWSARVPRRRRKSVSASDVTVTCPPNLSDLTLMEVNLRHGSDEMVLDLLDAFLPSGKAVSLGLNKLAFCWRAKAFITPAVSQLRQVSLMESQDAAISPQLLHDILNDCPSITSVLLNFHGFEHIEAVRSLPRHALPLLSSFAGTAELGQILIPGRPVRSAAYGTATSDSPVALFKLFGNDHLLPPLFHASLDALSASSAPITLFELLLPDFDAAGYEVPGIRRLVKVVPSLRVLRVHWPYAHVHKNHLIEAIGSHLMGPLQQLEEFRFLMDPPGVRTTPTLNLQWQHQLITRWSALVPSLRIVQVSSVIQWYKDFGQWTPVLIGHDALAKVEEAVQWILGNNRPLEDYDWEGTIDGWLSDKRLKESTTQRPAVLKRLNVVVQRLWESRDRV